MQRGEDGQGLRVALAQVELAQLFLDVGAVGKGARGPFDGLPGVVGAAHAHVQVDELFVNVEVVGHAGQQLLQVFGAPLSLLVQPVVDLQPVERLGVARGAGQQVFVRGGGPAAPLENQVVLRQHPPPLGVVGMGGGVPLQNVDSLLVAAGEIEGAGSLQIDPPVFGVLLLLFVQQFQGLVVEIAVAIQDDHVHPGGEKQQGDRDYGGEEEQDAEEFQPHPSSILTRLGRWKGRPDRPAAR